MMWPDLTLEIIEERDIPCCNIRAGEVVLAHTIMQRDALLHIGNPDGYILGLGKRGERKFYNWDKLRTDGIYVNRRNYGGSGAMLGPKDIIYSLHVNKACFTDGFDVDSASAYSFFNGAVLDTIVTFLGEAMFDTEDVRHREDGVCIHLTGRSEIITPEGSKMAVSVYREDEVGFYMNGAILVSDAWAAIYDYLEAPIEGHRIKRDSLEMRTNILSNLTGRVRTELIDNMVERFNQGVWVSKTDAERRAIAGIRDKYRVE